MLVALSIDMRALGERVLVLRRRLELSQQALARQAEVDVMTISRLERGMKKRLEILPLARLAQALGVTTDHLLGVDTPRRRTTPAPLPPRQPRTRTRRQSAVPARPRTTAPVG